MSELTPDLLAELERLEAAATPGPWEQSEQHGMDTIWHDILDGNQDEILSAEVGYIGHLGSDGEKRKAADLSLVAALRNAAPALLAAARERNTLFSYSLRLEEQAERAETELAELNATFNLRHAADMRAIAKWRESHPDNELIMPDQADLCVWLMERCKRLEDALSAVMVMWDRGDFPKKLDDAIGWRENDELARKMAGAALKESTDAKE